MNTKTKFPNAIVLSIATLVVSACGGGGSGGGGIALPLVGLGSGTGSTENGSGSGGNAGGTPPPPVVTSPTEPVADDSTLVTNISPASYAAASEELAAFTQLNAERLKCGFGLLKQNTMLDTAAAGHANYLLRNNIAGHFQNAGDPFFTGNSARDRATAAGYSTLLVLDDNNDTTGAGANVITGRGAASIRSLLSAPYHALSLLGPERDIGVSIMGSDTTGSTATHGPRAISQFNLGLSQGSESQKPSSAAVQTFPCQGTVGTAHMLRNESPNPIPDRDLNALPIGQPIMVAVRPGNGIEILAATLKVKAGGASVVLRSALTKTNDPNGMLNPSQAVLMPDVPLLPNTEYEVSISGRNTTLVFDGANWNSTGTNPWIKDNTTGAFNKVFTFTTGG